MKKTCKLCKETKDAKEFYKAKDSKDGRSSFCKDCNRLRCKQWKKENKDKVSLYNKEYRKNNIKYYQNYALGYNFKYNFDINIDDYNRIFKEQNGCCAICGEHQSKFKKRFAVDHDHSTNKIRGLLCTDCNLALGLFKDNLVSLQNAIKYLDR